MRQPQIFREYVWLVSVIWESRGISLEEINKLWVKTDMSGGVEMARSTFCRHKDAIEDIFGLLIECDRKNGYRYYISNSEVLRQETVQRWMLSTLSVTGVISESWSIRERILLESIPSEGQHLKEALEAMKSNLLLTVTYKKYGASQPKTVTVEPYCLKLFQRRWYLLVRYHQTGEMRTFSLDRIMDMTVTDEPFTMDESFDADRFFKDRFGIVSGDGAMPTQIVVRAYGMERYYLRDLPLHHSQRETASTDSHADFELTLCPSVDFISHLMSHGAGLRVLQPQWLADEIRRRHEEAVRIYAPE